MSFKLNFLFHDSVLFIYFKTFNILSTTAFSTDLKDELHSSILVVQLKSFSSLKT